jgi:hypothetical protein
VTTVRLRYGDISGQRGVAFSFRPVPGRRSPRSVLVLASSRAAQPHPPQELHLYYKGVSGTVRISTVMATALDVNPRPNSRLSPERRPRTLRRANDPACPSRSASARMAGPQHWPARRSIHRSNRIRDVVTRGAENPYAGALARMFVQTGIEARPQ